jgi:hypothetical protein
MQLSNDFQLSNKLGIKSCQNWDARFHGLTHKIIVPCKLVPIFRWWSHLPNLLQGLPWRIPTPSVTLTTDASLMAWGAHMGGQKVQGAWTQSQSYFHINLLEMLAVFKALKAFQLSNKLSFVA